MRRIRDRHKRLTPRQAWWMILIGGALMHWPPMPSIGTFMMIVGVIELDYRTR